MAFFRTTSTPVRFRRTVLSSILAMLWLAASSTPAAADTVTWTGGGDGESWSDPFNWDPLGVPLGPDDVVIDLDGTYTVDLDESPSLNSLTMGAATGVQTLLIHSQTLTLGSTSSLGSTTLLEMTTNSSEIVVNGDLTVAGGWTWNAGDVSGTATLILSGTATLTTGNVKDLSGATLRNLGMINWDAGSWRVSSGAVVDNQGLIDIQGDVTLTWSGAPGTLLNSSAVQKSGGAGGSTISVAYDQTAAGLLDAQSGTLSMAPSGSATMSYAGGTLDADFGATLNLAGGTHTISGTLSGDPAGTIATSTNSTVLEVGAGGVTLDFGGTGWRWQAGTVTIGTAGTLVNADLMVLTTGNTKDLTGGTLSNLGTIEWDGGTWRVSSGGVVDNQGLIDMQGNLTLTWTGVPGTLTNGDTVQKSGGTGTSTIALTYDQTAAGLLDAQSGTLSMAPAGTTASYAGGTLDADFGATLDLASGTHTVSGTISGDPAGTVALSSGSTTLEVGATGATIDFGGTGMQWEAGTIDASAGGDLTNADLIVLTTGPTKDLTGGTLSNLGTIEWDAGVWRVSSGGVVDNQGLIDIQGNLTLTWAVVPGILTNSGIVQKSGGTGTSTHTIDTVNQAGGVIDVTIGTLSYSGDLTNEEDAVIQGTGTISVTSATVTNEGIFAPGGSVGTLTHTGTYDQIEPTATLEIELAGLTPDTEHDVLAVTGMGIFGGEIDILLEPNYAPAVGDTFTVVTCSNGCSGDIPTVNEPSGATFDVQVDSFNVRLEATDVFAFTTSGECPSGVNLSITGATPNNPVAILRSSALGSFTVPIGACAGTEVDLDSPLVQATVNSNANGDIIVGPIPVPGPACGAFLQAVDVATCGVSTVGQLPLQP